MEPSGKCSILVLQGEPVLASLLQMHLHGLPARVTVRSDSLRAMDELLAGTYDLLVVDVHLPGMSGLDIVRALRSSGSAIPVLMVTEKASELDRVVGLEYGADDYMTKPIGLLELTARVRALLRRVARSQSLPRAVSDDCVAMFRFGELSVDTDRRDVKMHGKRLSLKPREFDLLVFLMRHPGKVFTREALLTEVWGHAGEGYSHTVNTHVNRIRAALGDVSGKSRFIHTVWGVGYRFEPRVGCAE